MLTPVSPRSLDRYITAGYIWPEVADNDTIQLILHPMWRLWHCHRLAP
jgi:hypothetical protein